MCACFVLHKARHLRNNYITQSSCMHLSTSFSLFLIQVQPRQISLATISSNSEGINSRVSMYDHVIEQLCKTYIWMYLGKVS